MEDPTNMTLRQLIVEKHTLFAKGKVDEAKMRRWKALDRELTRRAMNKWRETSSIKKY